MLALLIKSAGNSTSRNSRLTETAITVAIGIALAIIVGFFSRLYRRRRDNARLLAMQEAAQRMGWSFTPAAEIQIIPYAEDFEIFSKHTDHSLMNIISGQINDMKALIFDHRYNIPSGNNNRTTVYETVFYFETSRLDIPMFTLKPELLVHKIGSKLGYQDMDFNNRPEFSREYLLRGKNERAIRQLFTDRVLSFYEAHPGLFTEGGGSQFFIYHERVLHPAPELSSYLQWCASNVLPLFEHM